MSDALVIKSVNVEQLVPYLRNSRTHSADQVEQIAASIEQFGWTNPILIDSESGIVAGHGRLMAARKLGMTEVPCIELTGLTEAQRRAYIIADNKLATNAGWDFATLSEELADLDAGDFDLEVIGFTDRELEQIMTWAPDGTPGKKAKEESTPIPPSWSVLVKCDTELQQRELLERMTAEGLDVRALMS